MAGSAAHPAASLTGALTLAAWALYLAGAFRYYHPDYPASFWPLAGAGLLAALAVGVNFVRWRLVVILASCVYLAFYVVRVLRMVVLTSGFEISALPATVIFYFRSLWIVTVAMLQERGVATSIAHGYIEYAMPLLAIVLIAAAAMHKTK